MDLLQLFWQNHNPKRKAWSSQYKAIILYQNEIQHEYAQQSMTAVKSSLNAPVTTDILPLVKFYLAEEYHQKYRLQSTPLMEEMRRAYPNNQEWIHSTAAARLNGYLSGYGLAETFAGDVQQLGLSESGESVLVNSVARLGVPLTCPLP